MHERYAGRAGRARQLARALRVDRTRGGAMFLRAVDVGPGGAVDDGLRAQPLQGLLDRRRVGDVELRPREALGLAAGALRRAQEIVAEHAAGTRHEQSPGAHRMEMSELSPTMKR